MIQLLGRHSLFNVIVSAVKNDKIVISDLKEQNVRFHLEVLIHIFGFQQDAIHSCSPFIRNKSLMLALSSYHNQLGLRSLIFKIFYDIFRVAFVMDAEKL